MTNISIIIGILLACILVVRFVRSEESKSDRQPTSWVVMAVALLGALAIHFSPPINTWLKPIEFFLAGFGLAIGLLDFADSEAPISLGAPIGLCLAVLGLFQTEVISSTALALASLSGVGAAGALLALSHRGIGIGAFTAISLSGISSLVLGSSLDTTESLNLFVNLLSTAVISIVAGEILGLATKKSRIGWPKWATGIAFCGLALLISAMTSTIPEMPLFIAGAGLIAVILHVIGKGIEDKTVALMLGTLIWLGVATVTQNWLKGYGLSVVCLIAVMTSLICGERRLLAWISPMLALAMYRLVKFVLPDAFKSLDIGQHYAIVGILFGIFLPLLLLTWGKNVANRKPIVSHSAVSLAGVCALLGIALAVLVLGSKGATGLVFGLMISPAVSALKGEPPKSALPVGLSLAAWSVVCISLSETQETMARPDRLSLAASLGGIALLLGIAAALTSSLKFDTKKP